MEAVSGFLTGKRADLCSMALVCRLWRDVAVRDEYWEAVVQACCLQARRRPGEQAEGGTGPR